MKVVKKGERADEVEELLEPFGGQPNQTERFESGR
jgi:hypothetical protein